jgi:hypothetical protein
MFMRIFRIAFIFGLVLMFVAGCTKEKIQPDPLNAAEDISLKKAMVEQEGAKEEHYMPFNATFELEAHVNHYGPVIKYDDQTEWKLPEPNKAMHVDIAGSGKVSILGWMDFKIVQWWTKWYDFLNWPDSYGQGKITFTAANGDLLEATYYGQADHQDDPPTEILTHGKFIGGTGQFENAEGFFEWDGIFYKTHPVPMPPKGELLGTGRVKVKGRIKY